jgi:alkylhydroperoxidase/carboxymuconolactone decarboxylase family protein YurZ
MSAKDERIARGEKMRRQVMSDAYVDSRKSARDAFSGDLDDMITGFAWGEVWTRPGLDPKIRSVITLTITATRSQWDEFRIHVRGAINNGMSVEELKEALLHIAVYGGFPAARTGFREAQAVLKELEAERTLPRGD